MTNQPTPRLLCPADAPAQQRGAESDSPPGRPSTERPVANPNGGGRPGDRFDLEMITYLAFEDWREPQNGSAVFQKEAEEIERFLSKLWRMGIDELRQVVAFCDARGIPSRTDPRDDHDPDSHC